MKNKVFIMSFGFKYGHPSANYIFDISFLKNPIYKSEWENNGTNNPEMLDFIRSQPRFKEFVDSVIPLLEKCSEYTPVRAAFGCTGGRHRSRAVAEEVASILRSKGFDVELYHREMMDWGMCHG